MKTPIPLALVAAELISMINPAYTAIVARLGGVLGIYVVHHGARTYACVPHGRASEGVTIYSPSQNWTVKRIPRAADEDTLEPILATIRAEVRS